MKYKNLVPDASKDEAERDLRDWVGNSDTYIKIEDLPEKFEIEDNIYISQDKDWYKMSCSAQATINAANSARMIKADSRRDESEDLRDKVVEKWIAGNWGSYLIDIIKEAKESGIIDAYYQVDTLNDILNAIYIGCSIITWTNKINWYNARKWLVEKAEKWTGHAFCIIGWDKTKKIGNSVWALKCKNSYWIEVYDKWCFWIPFNLVETILFNTKKAVIVIPSWSKLNMEERFKAFKELKDRHQKKSTYM